MKKLTIHYFSKSVLYKVEALPSGILARYLYLIQRMQDTGSANLGFPLLKKLMMIFLKLEQNQKKELVEYSTVL
ncbi:MAG: hypothetical protein K0R14_499 [Burkholderiales bacterium]|jgi:hypothetical protein|nr:hypothetical protein [Burkholderiales bacterium]